MQNPRSKGKKIKKVFSKHFQKFSSIENLHHHYRNIPNSYPRYFYVTKQISQAEVSRILLDSHHFPFDSTKGETAVRIFTTDISRSKIERGRRFLMHRSLTIRNRKWDTKRCAVSSEEKGETIIHATSITRVIDEKYYFILTCANKKKNLCTCLKCNLTGMREEKRGMCCARAKKKKAIETTIIIRFGHPSTVQDFSSILGEGGNPRSKSFSNRYVFSHPPWKDIMRFHEEYKSYEIYCRTLLCLFISVSTF